MLTLALAAVWAVRRPSVGPTAPRASCTFRGSNRRPVITGTAIGVLLGGVFIVGGLVAREIVRSATTSSRVLNYANYGALWLVVLITVVNGVAEEMFFRGALYTALGKYHPETRLDGHLRDRGVGGGQPDARIRRASSSARSAPTNAESPAECSHPC